MNRYETIIIFTDEYNSETSEKAIVKYSRILHDFSSTPIKLDNMGKKRLAYPIKEHKEGWYVLFKFDATPENVLELERHLRIDDDVLKFIAVRVEDEDRADDDMREIEQIEEPLMEIKQEKQPVDVLDIIYGLNKEVV